MNRALPSLDKGSLEITLTVPLSVAFLGDIGRFCPNLKSFSATELEKITRDSILKHCKQLQKLDICGNITFILFRSVFKNLSWRGAGDVSLE